MTSTRFTRSPFTPARSPRRGSAMVLVVAILAVLLLLSISFTYTSKMDLLSARNWANTVQSKMAASTGVPLLVPSTTGSAQGATVALRSGATADEDYVDDAALDQTGASTVDEALDAMGTAAHKAAQLRQRDPEGIKPVAMRLKLSDKGFAFARAGMTPTPTPTPTPDSLNSAGAMVHNTARQAAQQITTQSLTVLLSDPLSNNLAQARMQDTAAKLNINAVIPVNDPFKNSQAGVTTQQAAQPAPSAQLTQDTLARLIAYATQGRGLGNVDAEGLAHAIALRRYGADEAPGIKGIDDNANGRTAQAEFDGIDNDHDRQIDNLNEAKVGITQDGLDNDRNGVADDLQETIESDGIDNNLDGKIDEPGEAIDDPAECSIDPRIPPAGDDRPYVSLNDLMSVPGMTVEIFRAIEPYLTIFSVSNNAFELTTADTDTHAANSAINTLANASETNSLNAASIKSKGWPRVDPNTAPAQRIYSALKQRFPEKSAGLLAQFTVNLIDRRDADSIPTELTIDGVTVIGIEMSAYINEVCPDVSSDDGEGDNGEFIELFNPWSKPINLSGYSLRGQGVNIPLSQTLPAGGYLVFTDDYDNTGDPESEQGVQSGSFYDIFGAANSGYGAQLVVVPSLAIADDAGTITLVNAAGETVDTFGWTNGNWDGRTNSFQRGDPRLRATRYAQATPLKANADFGTDATLRQQALEVQEKWQNQPFRSALDVMLVSTAYADSASTTGSKLGGNPWALPVLLDEKGKNLDAALIDVFGMGAVLPPRTTIATLQDLAGAGAPQFGQENTQRRVRASYLTRYLQNLPRCDRSFGAININTATPIVLASLPGMTPELLQRIFMAREQQALVNQLVDQQAGLTAALQDWTQAGDGLKMPRWRNLSDLLRDETIWSGSALYERLDALYPFSGLLATSSLSVEIHTEDRSLESVAAAEGRRRSFSEATRIISADRGAIETVFFQSGKRGDDIAGDPDLRYALPMDKISEINLAVMYPELDTSLIPYGPAPFGTIPAIAGRDASKDALQQYGTPARSTTQPQVGRMIPTHTR